MKVSFEITRNTVEKARPPGTGETSRAEDAKSFGTTGITSGAAVLTSGLAATAEPPNPGATPLAPPPEPGPRTQPTTVAPLRWPFPYAVNMSLTPRGEDRRLTPFDQLRTIADIFDVIRIAIEVRKDQVTQLDWDFTPKDRSASEKTTPAQQASITRLRAFFAKPDQQNDFDTWLRMIVEDVLVIDALSIYRHKTRGGDLYALELIDGSSIKPLIDPRGFRPRPPQIAYRQMIYGRPVKGGDCTTDDLIYRPRTVRNWTPYGLSPIECILLTVNTALSRQMFNLTYYAEGNVPEGLMSTPEGWTTDQIREFQSYWDTMIAGNFKQRQRLRFVGAGMAESVKQFKKEDFNTDFDQWLMKVTCAAIGVQPQEIGFTEKVNKASGEIQENISYRRGIKPLGKFLKAILDEIIAVDLKEPDFEAVYTGGAVEDRLAQARIDEIYLRMGKVSVDELRARDGEDMIGLGPMIYSGVGPPIFIEELIAGKDEDPLTSEPLALEPGIVAPVDGPAGASQATAAAAAAADAATQKLADDELGAFRRWCVKRVKVGKAIDVTKFATSVLPLPICQEIGAHIARHGGTLEAVDAAFKTVEKSVGTVRLKQQARRRYTSIAKGYFRDLSEALSAHMEAGITRLPALTTVAASADGLAPAARSSDTGLRRIDPQRVLVKVETGPAPPPLRRRIVKVVRDEHHLITAAEVEEVDATEDAHP